jgi:hypothetical protein
MVNKVDHIGQWSQISTPQRDECHALVADGHGKQYPLLRPSTLTADAWVSSAKRTRLEVRPPM